MAFSPEARAKGAEVRRRNAEERRQRQEAAGIPDSKVFGGDPGGASNPVLECHVGGLLVRDMPDEVQNRILYRQTDEGIAEANQGRSTSRVSVTSDPLSKRMEARRDAVRERGMELWEAPDPLKEKVAAHVEPGMRPKFLSPDRIKTSGMRGFEAVSDKNGDPVKVGNMILGQMPEEKAIARNKHYQARGNQLLRQITDKYKEEAGPMALSDQ